MAEGIFSRHDLQLEIFLVAIAVGASLQHTDFVVDPFN